MTKDELEIIRFLEQSNAIEGVYDADSLLQSLYAWNWLTEDTADGILTPSHILKTHKILMLHQPLQPDEKGYFRTIPVWIGGREAMPWDTVGGAIKMFCHRVNESSTEAQIQEDHVFYEKVHPFVDGNGRTGRIFMNWQRLRSGLPLLIIHTGEEQQEYYQWFRDSQ